MKYKYEINPCRRDGDSFEKCAETAPDIATWSVYRRGDDDLAEWLSDHGTKAEAQAEVERLHSPGNSELSPPPGADNHASQQK